MVYINKHVQPDHSPCLASLLEASYGHLTPELILRNVTAGHETGNMHIAIYDYGNERLVVAVAGPSDGKSAGTPGTFCSSLFGSAISLIRSL